MVGPASKKRDVGTQSVHAVQSIQRLDWTLVWGNVFIKVKLDKREDKSGRQT